MIQNPLVSIIITTYNKPKILLQRSLYSAVNQIFDNYEILIVDHGSTVEYPKFTDDYWRIRYVKITENSGTVCTARNWGVKEAKGKYIVFLDDDNELLPDFLKKTVDKIEQNELYAAVCTQRIVQFEHFRDIQPVPQGPLASIDWGWLMRKSVFDSIQYDEKMFFNEDADFGIAFHKKFWHTCVDEPLQIAYDSFGSSMRSSSSYPTVQQIDSINYFLEKNISVYQNRNELRYLYNLIARRYDKYGMRGQALKYFGLSFKSQKNVRTLLHLIFAYLGYTPYNWFKGLEERVSYLLRK